MRTYLIKHITLILCAMFTLQSCIEEFVADLPIEDTNLLVVEGTIVSDEVSQFHISKTIPIDSEISKENIANARLTIIGTDGLNLVVPFSTSRTYSVKVPKLNPEAEYSLQIECEGETYVTDPQKPFPTNPIESVDFNQREKYSPVNILVTTSVPTNPEETQYYRWTYEETWEVKADYRTNIMWDPVEKTAIPNTIPLLSRGWCKAYGRDIIASSSAYYDNNQIVKYRLYDIDHTDRRLGVLYSTLVKQRSITKEEYEYENERRRISQDMGGLFTPQPSVLPTNIRCTTSSRRAIGYIGCSAGYATKRLFINEDEVSTLIETGCKALYSTDKDFPGDDKLYEQGYLLFMHQPALMGGFETGWTTRRCLDVKHIGAKGDMPPYWPGYEETNP